MLAKVMVLTNLMYENVRTPPRIWSIVSLKKCELFLCIRGCILVFEAFKVFEDNNFKIF